MSRCFVLALVPQVLFSLSNFDEAIPSQCHLVATLSSDADGNARCTLKPHDIASPPARATGDGAGSGSTDSDEDEDECDPPGTDQEPPRYGSSGAWI
jgi:hypothetical protein